MIKVITLTLSPAVDVEYAVPALDREKTNRSKGCTVKAGGKGINVSRCIRSLAEKAGMADIDDRLITVAVTGGDTGILLQRMAESENIRIRTVKTAGRTRINTSIIAETGDTVEVNSPSPPVGDSGKKIIRAVEKILKVEKAAGNECVVVMAGSLPSDLEKDYYAELIHSVKIGGGYAVLDCDGLALRLALNSFTQPDFIKPNIHELSEIAEITGKKLKTAEDVSEFAATLGDLCVITTLGDKGVVVTYGEGKKRKSSYVPVKAEKVCRLKGAGDTFLGAFIYHYYIYTEKKSIPGSVRYANRIAADFVSGRLSFD